MKTKTFLFASALFLSFTSAFALDAPEGGSVLLECDAENSLQAVGPEGRHDNLRVHVKVVASSHMTDVSIEDRYLSNPDRVSHFITASGSVYNLGIGNGDYKLDLNDLQFGQIEIMSNFKPGNHERISIDLNARRITRILTDMGFLAHEWFRQVFQCDPR